MTFKFKEGERVDYVTKGKSHQPVVKGVGVGTGIDAPEEGSRVRAVIDKIIDESTVRVVLTDSMETIWAHPDEIEALGVIDKLADMVGPESRSLKDGLADLDD